MILNKIELSQIPNGVLRWLALIFSNFELRVVVSERAPRLLTVVLETRTLVLSPQAGLYDLALGSVLMSNRPLRKQGPTEPDRKDRWLTLKARKLAAQAQAELRRRFPGIDRLEGQFKPGTDLDGLAMVDKAIDWRPLPFSIAPFIIPGTGVPIEGHVFPGLQMMGMNDDLDRVLESLEAPNFPWTILPGLDEAPCVRIPLQIWPDQCRSTTEEIEEVLSNAENQQLISNLRTCFTRKAEVSVERKQRGPRTQFGRQIDTTHLVDALIQSRLGPARLFRKKASQVEPLFDPTQMLFYILWDLNDLFDAWERPRMLRFLLCMLEFTRQMEVDAVVDAVADRFVTLKDGRTACLQFQVSLKSIDESFDVVWHRLIQMMDHPAALPGVRTTFHPFQTQRIVQVFETQLREFPHRWRTLFWWSRHAMSHNDPKLLSPGFGMRMAESIDHQFRTVERMEGTFDNDPCYLPRDLCQYGLPGGFLESVRFH